MRTKTRFLDTKKNIFTFVMSWASIHSYMSRILSAYALITLAPYPIPTTLPSSVVTGYCLDRAFQLTLILSSEQDRICCVTWYLLKSYRSCWMTYFCSLPFWVGCCWLGVWAASSSRACFFALAASILTCSSGVAVLPPYLDTFTLSLILSHVFSFSSNVAFLQYIRQRILEFLENSE